MEAKSVISGATHRIPQSGLSVSDLLQQRMQEFSRPPHDRKTESEWILLSQQLARECPEAGLNWLLGLPDSASRTLALNAFGSQLTASDPTKAKKMLLELLGNEGSAQSYGSFAGPVLKAEMVRSFDGGLELLAALVQKGGDEDSYLMGLTARMQSAKNHEDLLKLAEKFPDKIAPESLGLALYQVWKKDAAAAQAKIDSIPDERRVSQACRAMASSFYKDNPEEAMRWVRSMPEGVVRDGAMAGLAGAISHKDPFEAARWIVSIGDEAIRRAHGSIILPMAAGKDFSKIENLITTSSFSDEEKVWWMEFCRATYKQWQVP